MTERWPDLAGRQQGSVHVLPVRVYYEDTDAGGVVYHANYLKFCERARSDCLRILGIHQNSLEDMFFVVRRMTCDFLKPARLDDLLEVETRFIEMAGARLELQQRVMLNGNTQFKALVTVALIDGRGRPKRLPDFMAERLKSFPDSQS
ncbi:tol-pal system-associated acyl-CoA thioesterase [Aestuariivirga sp.]|uniref:tol-pal system-associated acyl-CoA thioesterase n=1 Tax=Aestuariivirga sp. TaxID=2650926 RepID=UPI0035942DF2